MKKITVGIVAHVDSGKTTLSEGMLYLSGKIRKLGRVDHKDAYLDTYLMEKQRGITIFSKQAIFQWQDVEVTLLDTPGHVDFSAEMERTLQVLDYAILVVNGSDGVQGHTETLWKLLIRYQVPTFIFVNKMDLVETHKKELLSELREKLSGNCIDFSKEKDLVEFYENLAMCKEEILDAYMEAGKIELPQIKQLIQERLVFPCFFGSALELTGVEELLEAISIYAEDKVYADAFAAKVYKIGRDEQNCRLTYMKILGGTLQVKQLLSNSFQVENGCEQGEIWKEKAEQIRIYSGSKYESVREITAGSVCAVTGLNHTFPGGNLGEELSKEMPILEPVLNYKVILPQDCSPQVIYPKLKELEEEEPKLHVNWNSQTQEITMQLMGEIQIEILKELIKERFQVQIEFGTGRILYKETIANTVEGVGHFEPLKHYAEVHLCMEPGEPGSGLQFYARCSEEQLDKNWQRLILTHLEEKEHVGVLTGSPITDIRITLVAGKAHQKHTEGGDFRQATYRAVRQGLKMAESVLLEPYYHFVLTVPYENLGRAMSDIQRRNGTFDSPNIEGENGIICGLGPVSTMQDYIKEVNAYTHGRGRITYRLNGYAPCHNSEEVVEKIGYDSEKDIENPTSSVFCSHGAGFLVSWDEVSEYMHIESVLEPKESDAFIPVIKRQNICESTEVEEAKLQKIMEREFGKNWNRYDDYGNVSYGEIKEKKKEKIKSTEADPKYKKESSLPKKDYLLVDGYNIIFSWKELTELAKVSLDAARMKLLDLLCNYQGYKKNTVIVVFDAYKIKGNRGSIEKYNNIHVVFTKEAETADMYIEKTTHEIGKKHRVVVATSDGIEQMIILQQGAVRMSARELEQEVEYTNKQIREHI
ncbi:MAG: TetM/TetW/TetO/TetS family tetracycline resistance ribosomal protection protein [Lachnospiraceae bacterium]|nr:TetM/TetW/TetO/TetS family tetracycline resistance ribosomal protection protein [Lachnospiraceae bacterium]